MISARNLSYHDQLLFLNYHGRQKPNEKDIIAHVVAYSQICG